MANTSAQGIEMNQLFESWFETANKFWKDANEGKDGTFPWSDLKFNRNSEDENDDEDSFKTYKTWESSFANFTNFLNLMLSPENQDEFTKSSTTFAEMLTQTAEESLENFNEFQSHLVQSFAKFGEHTKAYNFDDLDHTAFESFRDYYRSEYQKYFLLPKIGLPREFQEQLGQLADKSTLFHSYLLELFYQFYLPFEKTNRVMQKKIKVMMEKGELGDDSKQIYNEWIKVLEGHFMQLLKSKDYTDVLNNTIGSLAAYKGAKNQVTDVFLKELQIPTNVELDEVYKDIYLMKKELKQLSRKVGILQGKKNPE